MKKLLLAVLIMASSPAVFANTWVKNSTNRLLEVKLVGLDNAYPEIQLVPAGSTVNFHWADGTGTLIKDKLIWRDFFTDKRLGSINFNENYKRGIHINYRGGNFTIDIESDGGAKATCHSYCLGLGVKTPLTTEP